MARNWLFGALLLVALATAGLIVGPNAFQRTLLPVVADGAVIVLPTGSVIAAEGDSLTYGMDVSPTGGQPAINNGTFVRSRSPFPETLAATLGQCSAINRGFPGDRSVDGLVRWQDAPATELTILMFGSNDALNNGHASSGPVNLKTFRFTMDELVDRRRRAGSRVILIVPPPIGDRKLDARIEPFRKEVRAMASDMHLPLVDAVAVLKDVQPIWTPDYIHLSVEANRAIAATLATLIRCG